MFNRLLAWFRRVRSESASKRLVKRARGDLTRLSGAQLRFVGEHGPEVHRPAVVREMVRRQERIVAHKAQRAAAAIHEVPERGTNCAVCARRPAATFSAFLARGKRVPVCPSCHERLHAEAKHDPRVQLQPGAGYGKFHKTYTPHREGEITPDDADLGR